ncbi:hypothetical protein, partial [Acinetobacter baumannii]|uniref:hypothetical protein n=1 Tax=Acinetobacter baumannii TaxID=470 RepID=UPI00312C83FE
LDGDAVPHHGARHHLWALRFEVVPRQQYEWTTEFVVPCLEEAGHPITNIPSESVFLERWTSERPFFPFEQVQIPGGGSAEQFNKAWN